MHRDSCPLDCKVYVGNLGNNGNKTELERAFGYYGPLRSVWVARNPPGFAFVEFEDPRDAADAVRELDGRTLCGCRVRVELSNGEKRSRNRGPPPSWNRRPRDDYRRRSPPPRRRYVMLFSKLYNCLIKLGLCSAAFIYHSCVATVGMYSHKHFSSFLYLFRTHNSLLKQPTCNNVFIWCSTTQLSPSSTPQLEESCVILFRDRCFCDL
ncbi:hypothetical protein XENTR_v10005426 [Xenopus tropicalis]|nr:hypothetical protein XENTR_v10005426 [Xenopus tropicalis]